MFQRQTSPGLIGDVTKARFFAAGCDSLLAICGACLLASQLSAFGSLLQGVSLYALYFAYYFLGEAVFGATIGKRLFGLRVLSVTGEPCRWSQALIRTIARAVEVNPLLLGALPAGIAVLASPRKQRLGDLMAGTVVVPSRSSPNSSCLPATP